jgi:hypothetical protein
MALVIALPPSKGSRSEASTVPAAREKKPPSCDGGGQAWRCYLRAWSAALGAVLVGRSRIPSGPYTVPQPMPVE